MHFFLFKESLFISSFTIRYVGEFIQEFAESHILICHVSKVLPQHCSLLTFRWLPELPENNYHQHPAYRPRTRKPPQGLCGGAPDPGCTARLTY